MREGVVVADSGLLIGLARIEQLHLLPALASRILLPQAVWNEVTAAKTEAPGALEISQATWIEVQQVNPTPSSRCAFCSTQVKPRQSLSRAHCQVVSC